MLAQDRVDASDLSLGDEISLGEVQTIELVDLKRSKQHRGIDRLDCPQPDRRPHQLGDPGPLDFVERLQDIHAFREHEIGQQKVVRTPERSRGSHGRLRRVAGQVADHDVRIDERRQRCRPVRAPRDRLRTSSHGVPAYQPVQPPSRPAPKSKDIAAGTSSGAEHLSKRAMIALVDDGTTRAALDPDHDERFLSLRRALGVTSFGINQMILQPGQRMRIHRHRHQEEVYLVLEGALTVAIDGDETELARGELMRVAPGVRRQLINYGPGRVLLIALGGSAEHDGRDAEAFGTWDQESGQAPRDVPLPDDLPPAERHS
jgi:mannose-6-phosphate isomerase-like protein (cupin superfamily)